MFRGRGVGVPVPQGSVPNEQESIFINVFEMIESSHTLLLSFRGSLLCPSRTFFFKRMQLLNILSKKVKNCGHILRQDMRPFLS